jgi:Holliday junction resolvasome RuvABC endonuclease subunit
MPEPDAAPDRGAPEPKGGILSFDFGGRCGYAVCGPDFRPRLPLQCGPGTGPPVDFLSGVAYIAESGTDHGLVFLTWETLLLTMIERHRPKAVTWERPVLGDFGGPAAELAVGFQAIVKKEATRLNIWARPVAINTVKKFWTGRGRAEKIAMIAAAQARGYDVDDDNEADAIAILDYTATQFLALQKLT